MINNVVLVGRTANEPVIHVLENGVKVCSVDLAIVRPFRNANNENETDAVVLLSVLNVDGMFGVAAAIRSSSYT